MKSSLKPPSGSSRAQVKARSTGNTWSSHYYHSLYGHEKQTARTNIAEARPFVIYGGRALGKSSILEWIKDELIVLGGGYQEFCLDSKLPEDSRTFFLIKGKEALVALGQLNEAAEKKIRPMVLLIDDFDLILEEAKSSNASDIQKVLDNLRKFLPVGNDDSGNRLIVTATEDIHEPRFDDPKLRREEGEWSRVFGRIDKLELDPWFEPSWKEDLIRLIRDELISSTSVDSTLAKDVRGKLAEITPSIVAKLSGGHPNLTGQFLDILDSFWRKSEDLRDALEIKIVQLCESKGGPEKVEPVLARYLEDRLARSPRGLRWLRRSVQQLQDPDGRNLEGLTAFSELIRIARSGDQGAQVPQDLAIRHKLTQCSLVFNDPVSLRFVVPGSVLQKEVLRHQGVLPAHEELSPPKVSVTSTSPKGEGVLVVIRPGAEPVQVPLDGNNWKIMEVLQKKRGEVVPIEDLSSWLEAQPAATRSALRRFREKLGEYKVQEILENAWGKGYRLIEPS